MEPSRSDSKRVRKAFKLLNRILFAYIRLIIAKKLFGNNYYQKRVHKRHEKYANLAKTRLMELQGLFIKVGQMMSMMANILPTEYVEALEALQDSAPAGPFEDTKEIIEEDLGDTLDNLFAHIDHEPIASASIGQVYKATLKTGQKVAIKVRHKGVEELAKADLEIIRKMIKRVNFFLKINGLEYVYDQINKMIMEELDFKKEQESMKTISANLEKVDGVSVPEVFDEYSSSRIITTAFQDAVKITNVKQIDDWGLDREMLSKNLILAYCKMILEDGFYHADPHPGNVFVREDGEIILLDFGATAELNQKMREQIPVLIQAAIRKDSKKIVQALKKMGFIGNDEGSEKLAHKIVETVSEFLSNEVDIKNLNISNISFDDVKGSSLDKLRKELSIRELSKTVQVPKDWVLLDRTIILIGGINASISPQLDPVEVIKPYLKKNMLSASGIRNMIVDAIKQQFNSIVSLPYQLDTFLKKANEGKLEITVNNDSAHLYALGQQFILVVLILASVLFYYLSNEQFWLYILTALILFLLRSIWKNRMRS